VEELPTEVRAELFPVETPGAEKRSTLFADGLEPEQRKLWDLLSVDQPSHVDELLEKSGMTSSGVLAALCELELKGMVRQIPGKQFVRAMM